ncbi:enoyl-CoA hydratase/isomerase family protein [Streptomyces sp. AJS327]|uniref:enoyl-CoA hydratase/isomerase family protein n=1 Tax=Streptomyces sp. AJS327 TaxID=2545265 RepID=UPI0015DF9320|nr:enoyl-CoA hydratase/isomerase family protein [Streptomyces sp. AJS327]MBA0052273.1 enoyl-CoA hydratase/isomerase family protein [Streptomyces sp. AJS327]
MEQLEEPSLGTTVDAGIATVTIRNPAKRNAMTPRMWRQLPELLQRLARDTTVRALVLTGAGETFCAGADIGSLRETVTESQNLSVGAEEALAAFPRPTLAVVRGHCVGGGCQLAAGCDLRFAAEDATFGITPAKLGIVYPEPSARRLTRLVGPASAKYLLFSGELIDAARALRTGLVDETHPAGHLADRVAEFTGTLARRSGLTQAAAKECVDGRADPERVADWRRTATESGEATEGVTAFLERRAPRFTWPA